MRERRLVQVTVVSNLVVLSLAVAVWAAQIGGAPVSAVVPGGSAPAPPAGGVSPTPTADAPLPDPHPVAHLVDLPAHELEHLPAVPRRGVLDGDADQDGGCVWIVTDDGPQASRWPAGTQAAFAPGDDGETVIELVDASGGVLAHGGDTIVFTGARSGVAERLERCHVGADHVWYIGEVVPEAPIP